MPKRPSPPQPRPLLSWDNLRAAAKAKPLGTVEAADADEAIEKAAKEFRLDPAKLMAERR